MMEHRSYLGNLLYCNKKAKKRLFRFKEISTRSLYSPGGINALTELSSLSFKFNSRYIPVDGEDMKLII